MVYNPDFQWKRKTVTISVSTSSLPAGYQVRLIIPKENEMQSDFRDLRFETIDGYGLSHWLESINTTPNPDEATVWVKLKDAVTAGPSVTVIINMYYGNPYVSSISNVNNTLDFYDDFTYTAGSFSSNSKWTKYVSGNYYAGSDVLIENGKLKLHIAGACYACSGQSGVCSTNTFSTSNPIVIKYVSSPITKTFFGDWDQGGAWPAGFILSASAGYPSSTGNNYFSIIDNYNGDFYIQSYDTVTYRTLYTAVVGNITKNIEIKIDSTNVIVTLNGVVKYNGPHYLNASNRYIHFYRYADQRTWIDQTYDDLSVRKYVATEPSTPTIGSTATNVNWNPQRKSITINTTTATPTNYQVKLTIPFSQEMNIDFSDLRFVTKANLPVSLDYWIESFTPGITADIWVELADAINASSSDYIYMHYGNPNLTSVSNARNTFIVYDDFSTGSSEQWTMANVTADRTTNHRLNINGVSGSTSAYLDKGTDIGNYEFLYKYMRTSGGGTGFGAGVGDTITNNFTAQNNGFAGDDHPNQANTNIMKYLYVNPIGNVNGIAAGSANTTYYVKLTKLNNVFNYIGYSDLARTSQIWGLTYTKSGAELTNQRYIYGVMSAVDWGYVTTGWLSGIRIRKLVATEPSFSIGIAESMNSFSYRKTLTINNNSGGILTDYQVPITVAYSSHMQSNFNDIRFVDINNNLLPYWIESKTDNSTANVWIKVNLPNYGTSPTGDNVIYMYYGNSSITSASDGTNTFIVYDHFEGNSLNTNMWNISGVGSYSLSNSILTINAPYTTNMVSGLSLIKPFTGSGTIVEAKYKFTDTSSNNKFGVSIGGTGSSLINSSYIFYHDQDAIYFSIYNTAGIPTHLGSMTKTTVDAVYKLINDGTNIQWVVDNVLKITGTSASYLNGPMYIKWGGYITGGGYSGPMYIDYAIVRKYTSLAPTYTTGAEEQSTGSLDISSTPSGAEIFIDTVDQLVTTPRTITNIIPGDHTYELTLSGYVNHTDTFTITSGSTTTISVTMVTPAHITATSLIITPSTTPCISGDCTVTVDVIWTNTGETSDSFIPSIKIDTIPTTPALDPVTLGPSGTRPQQFVILGMTTGTHTICPDPN